jgi:hypothetical protein
MMIENNHGELLKELPWKHETQPVYLSLVVDDFGITYVGRENENGDD